MDRSELFKQAGEVATKFIEGIKPDQWGKLSNCGPWTVKDLVNHLTYEMLWIPSLVAEGKTVAEVGDKYEGDVLGDNPVQAFKNALAGAEKAFAAPEALSKTVHLSFGDFPGSYYCGHSIEELVIHGWDIAVSTNQKDDLPEELINAVWEIIKPEIEEWRSGGFIGKEVKVSENADAQTKLLAALGRDRAKLISA